MFNDAETEEPAKVLEVSVQRNKECPGTSGSQPRALPAPVNHCPFLNGLPEGSSLGELWCPERPAIPTNLASGSGSGRTGSSLQMRAPASDGGREVSYSAQRPASDPDGHVYPPPFLLFCLSQAPFKPCLENVGEPR